MVGVALVKKPGRSAEVMERAFSPGEVVGVCDMGLRPMLP